MLGMAGIGIMSDCNCSTSSFNPALFKTVNSYTYRGKASDAPFTMKVLLDTVSSVCGLADGFTFCPHSIEFRNKETGTIVTFPSNGHSWNAKTFELTINPA